MTRNSFVHSGPAACNGAAGPSRLIITGVKLGQEYGSYPEPA